MKALTDADVRQADVWAEQFNTVPVHDIGLVALNMMTDLGNTPVLRCTVHDGESELLRTPTNTAKHRREHDGCRIVSLARPGIYCGSGLIA